MRLRPLGLVVTLLLLAGAYLAWINSRREGTTPASPAPPRRGGQIVATIRSQPRSFNRYVARDQTTDLIAWLTQATLVRVNRATFELEPWLAERWESSPDGRTHTLHLRDAAWSDGTPFTSADVLFSLEALFDSRSESVLASSLMVGGSRITASAPDARTVVVRYPAPSGPGLRLLDTLVVLRP